ncbi:MAG: hypothetical protein CMI02_03860 [Oceanospirillaceae bacterium]|nr:hypothetical protein [Oceanospirillaceae bacterium]MBT11155.1 hypothetical protein [Oceanospirillaceae bacterium]
MSESKKRQLKAALLAALDEEIQAALDGATQAHETASHEDNKPENQYDTLALEAAYLAHGQSERIRTLQETRIRISHWQAADYSDDEGIQTGVLVMLQPVQHPAAARWLWITPVGGRQLQVDGHDIQVISTQAPLARQLMQCMAGDDVMINQQRWEVADAW